MTSPFQIIKKIASGGSFAYLWLASHAIALAQTQSDEAVDPCDNPQTAEQKLDCLFPSQESLIEGSPHSENSDGSITSLPSGDLIGDFLPFILNTMTAIAGTLIFIAIMYSSYEMIFANDNEEKIEKAKKILLWSVIGAFVMAISYAVIFGIANLDLD